jgi:hypothetical protein
MGLVDLLRKMFGSAGAKPADVRRLSGASERDLASSLRRVPRGERGWITLSEAVRRFSDKPMDYAFGETDDEGKRRLDEFAAKCNCDVQIMPTEERVYFTITKEL